MQLDDLGHTCVVGLQWGDEGKGKVVDLLVRNFDVVVRYSGGANAGHTVVADGQKYALHQLPTGVLHPGVTSMIGCGAVVDPAVLLGEIESLRQRGFEIGDNLRISDRCHLVFPYHRRQDALAERSALPGGKLGTTGRGIGPAYADKVSRRWGVRVCELLRPERLRERLRTIVAHRNAYLAALYDDREPFDAEGLTAEYLEFAEQLRPYICDVAVELAARMRRGQRVLFEGAQGTLLDIDHGTYPYVTSASTGVGGVGNGAGVPPQAIRSVIGVIKAYATRVGAGPFPTELTDALGDRIRERGREFGTTTGRPRRCGWFDAVAARYAITLTGPRFLALMHIDTLSSLEELKICTGYRLGRRKLNTFPADAYSLEEVEPVYETLPGWQAELSDCRRLSDLPRQARSYIRRISRHLGVPVGIVSVGPAREQTIFCEVES